MSILQKSSTQNNSKHKKYGIKPSVLFLVLIFLLALSFFLSLCFGSVSVNMGETLQSLCSGDFEAPSVRILLHLRLPRLCGAILSGMALAVAGVLIQGVLHNSMAAPNIIGVNSGAGLGAVLMLTVFPSAVSFLPFAAFFGALCACLLIYGVSLKTGASPATLILVGIAVSSLLNAGINAVKILFPDSVYDADVFMIGGFSGLTFSRIFIPAVVILLGLAAAMLFSRNADILSLGDDTAKSLGMNVKSTQFFFLVLASVLSGCAVSFAGLLGFVGLVVPHVARRFVGQNHGILIPFSALGGGILVLVCDLLSRVLFAPYEIPVGILLSVVGAPFFLFLILSGRKYHD